jgi:hypothetical protein
MARPLSPQAVKGGFYSLGGPLRTVYIDSQCKSVNASATVCGEIVVRFISTPVSLVWSEGADRVATSTVVAFPFDTARSAHYRWMASADLPLVVYDPEHTGIIRTPDQLFGNRTFGKRWSNGYEALGALDSNRDGKVAGDERSPLALWFDRNQNGQSESGEVVRLIEAGVTELFYEHPTRYGGSRVATLAPTAVDHAGGLRLSHGYTAQRGISTVQLPSIDWFAPEVVK